MQANNGILDAVNKKNIPVNRDVREDSVLELLVVVFDFEGVIGVPLHVIGIFVVLS